MKREFQLRPFKKDDLSSLVQHANNPKIASNMTNGFPHPYTKEIGEKFIEMAMQQPIHIFAITVDEDVVGAIGIHPQHDIHCKNAELGYWISEEFWGLGITTEAIKQMIPKAFELYPINRLFARPFGSNLASQRALVKSGFKLEARLKETIFKNGKFQDELIYAIRSQVNTPSN